MAEAASAEPAVKPSAAERAEHNGQAELADSAVQEAETAAAEADVDQPEVDQQSAAPAETADDPAEIADEAGTPEDTAAADAADADQADERAAEGADIDAEPETAEAEPADPDPATEPVEGSTDDQVVEATAADADAAAADDEVETEAGAEATPAEVSHEARSSDPIEVASQFANATPSSPAATAGLVPEQGSDQRTSFWAKPPHDDPNEIPALAPVDEFTMPEMAAVVPEPDLHLRPAFQPASDSQYGTVSAFRRDRAIGAGAPVPVAVPTPPQTPPSAPPTLPTPPISAAAASTVAAPESAAPPAPAPAPPMPTVTPSPTVAPTPLRAPLDPPRRPASDVPRDIATSPSPAEPAYEPQVEPAPAPARQPRRRPRRARLRLSKVDPWTVMKISFLFAIALAIVTLIAVALLWGVLNAMGVFAEVGQTVGDITGGANDNSGVDVETMFSLSRVLKFAGLIAILQTLVVTCLATLGAFLYNASSGLVGGIEITLTEAD
ncbi:MAG: DUF3566 domain-containing protein [Sporichthyaceae bacterium]|nr:DUF3566 domain-containing protein [Sporichthyaceae bacterium]